MVISPVSSTLQFQRTKHTRHPAGNMTVLLADSKAPLLAPTFVSEFQSYES